MNDLLYKICLTILCIFSFSVNACDVISVGSSTISLPQTVKITSKVMAGEAITPEYGPFWSSSAEFKCDYIPDLFLSFSSYLEPSQYNHIYKTNLPGVGVKVWSKYEGDTFVDNTPVFWYTGNAIQSVAWIESIYIQYFALDNIESELGVVSLPSPLIKASTSNNRFSLSSDSVDYAYLGFSDLDMSVEIPTCSIESRVINMPSVNSSQFSGIGSNVANVPFSIGISCKNISTLSYYIEDANLLTNRTSYFSLSPSSNGSGVSFQMIDSDTDKVILFGAENSIEITSSMDVTDGYISSIPFYVRYVKTSDALFPGEIEAKAVITFDYK